MQADIYSYGKVCAWILFGQEMSIDDFARPPFDFKQAVSQQMRRMGTGWDELRDKPAVIQSMIISLLEEFFERSFQDFTRRREEKIELLMENWGKLCDYRYHFCEELSAKIESDEKFCLTISTLKAVTKILQCVTLSALLEHITNKTGL